MQLQGITLRDPSKCAGPARCAWPECWPCYKFREGAKLFGCNEGFIPWFHDGKIPKGQKEPWRWHIAVRASLDDPSNTPSYENCSLIIDLKPSQKETNLSLYEILDIWGFSMGGWTPILLRLAGLFIDEEDPKMIRQRQNLVREDKRNDSPIYEFLYISGSVDSGELTGPWTLQ
jgi:hypothetical protein